MKRALLTQIKNEWRDNVWLVIELAVVTAAIWVIVTILYAMTSGLFEDRGFTPNDVYVLETKFIRNNSPEYVATGDTTGNDYYVDRNDLLRRLREHPDVEAVALSAGALPYNYNYNGNVVQELGVTDSIYYYGNMRWGSPDIVKVLKVKSLTGVDENRLAQILKEGGILVSNNAVYEENDRDAMKFKGKNVILGNDSSTVYRVGDVIASVRRNDYEIGHGGTIIVPLNEDKDWSSEVVVRVKPGRGDAFKAAFRADKNLQRQRNVYLTDIKSLMDIREGNQRNIDTSVRMFFVVMGFLLVTVFLGLLGSFWFRMQQRVSEIAIRKVCGAKRSDMFRRILGEGMILLGCAVIIASACIWPFYHHASDIMGVEWYELLVIECIAIVLVAIGIVLSVIYPARRAMSIEPAIAIKDE